jgi:MerR family transcriptional regulator, light-induced transcriptional regulator
MASWRPQVVRSHAHERVSDPSEGSRASGSWNPALGYKWSSEQLSRLAQTLAKEVIPHLSLAQRSLPRTSAVVSGTFSRPATRHDVDQLVEIVLRDSEAVAVTFVQTLQTRGVGIDSIYLDLLAPAARRLGDWWSHDHCNCAELTLGLCRLQVVLRTVSRCFDLEAGCLQRERHALLVTVPGEQHLFGLMLAAEFFFRAGWSVRSEFPGSDQALSSIVDSERFDVFHLSLSCSLTRAHRLNAVSAAVRVLRKASRNPAARVIVSGRAFVERPELVSYVGADIAAPDARQEVLRAGEEWDSQRAGRVTV